MISLLRLADIPDALTNVRFRGNSRHRPRTRQCPLMTQSGSRVLYFAVMHNELLSGSELRELAGLYFPSSVNLIPSNLSSRLSNSA